MKHSRRKSHCKAGHPFDEKNTLVTTNGKRICHECHRRRQRSYYQRDEHLRTLSKARSKRWRQNHPERFKFFLTRWQEGNQRWIDEYKAERGCSKCPERDIACLDFHHRDAGEKEINIGMFVKRWSIERLGQEIAKCDVLCANCHRKHHRDERERQGVH